MARATLRRIGLSDARIDALPAREGNLELLIAEALQEQAQVRAREDAWVSEQISKGAIHVPLAQDVRPHGAD